jgi:ribose transport system permease protein
MRTDRQRLALLVLQNTPAILFVVLLVAFSLLSSRFLTVTTGLNILTQSSHVVIMAIGMTFVLLVAGVDLSVGSNMYISAIVLGIYLKDAPLGLGIVAVLATGLLYGVINAVLITRLRITAFIATLATLFIGRGVGLFLSDTKMVFMGRAVTSLGRTLVLGVPLAIWVVAVVFVLAWVVLRQTPYGRQIYAVGTDPEAAAKAGIDVRRILFSVYCICGVCAALGSLVSLTQVAAASASFGNQKEFAVIAAAVLGGTSLFGGRGGVGGAVFGAVLIQTVETGLTMINADPYIYPLVVSAIIFLAVLVDSRRTELLEQLERRHIRVEPARAGDR